VPTSDDGVHRNGPRVPEPLRRQITGHNADDDAMRAPRSLGVNRLVSRRISIAETPTTTVAVDISGMLVTIGHWRLTANS
jgi:hypothetical protein